MGTNNVGSATGAANVGSSATGAGDGVRVAEVVGSATGGAGSATAGDDGGGGVTSLAGVNDGGSIGIAALPLVGGGGASIGDDPVEGVSVVRGTAIDMLLANSPPRRIVRPQNTESSSSAGCFNSHFSPSSTA
jgi:hypothetical protein